MKLDSRQKYQRLRRYVAQLKNKQQFAPFVMTQDISKYGVFDFFCFSSKEKTFSKMQKKLKDSKYDELYEFVQDIKAIYQSVSDYLFTDDPLQALCEKFTRQIEQFAEQFVEEFKLTVQPRLKSRTQIPKSKDSKQNKQSRHVAQIKQPKQPRQSKNAKNIHIQEFKHSSSLADKLQMIFLLKTNENNQSFLRSIGHHYNVGHQTEQQYIITIDDKTKYWQQFLDRNKY